MFQDNGHKAQIAAPFEHRNLADEETPTAMPEHADFPIVANPSADHPYTAEPTCTLTALQEYTDFATVFNPSGTSGHQCCTAGPSEHINVVNKATPTVMQDLAATETSPEPPNVEYSQLTSIQTEVMEVDDFSGCPSHNSVNAASDKVIES